MITFENIKIINDTPDLNFLAYTHAQMDTILAGAFGLSLQSFNDLVKNDGQFSLLLTNGRLEYLKNSGKTETDEYKTLIKKQRDVYSLAYSIKKNTVNFLREYSQFTGQRMTLDSMCISRDVFQFMQNAGYSFNTDILTQLEQPTTKEKKTKNTAGSKKDTVRIEATAKACKELFAELLQDPYLTQQDITKPTITEILKARIGANFHRGEFEKVQWPHRPEKLSEIKGRPKQDK